MIGAGLRGVAKFLLQPGIGPAGMSRLDMLFVGIGGSPIGGDPNDDVLAIDNIGPNTQVSVEKRGTGGLISQDALIQIGLERSRMLPHVATSAFKSAPTQIGALYKPIHDLAAGASNAFRRAQLPRVTGLEGNPTLKELIADALAGARIGVASVPPPWGPPPPYKDLAWLAGIAAAKLAQLWGFFNRTPEQPQNTVSNGQIEGPFGNWGGTVNKNGYVSGRFSCATGAMTEPPWTINANQGIGATGSYGIKWETTAFTQRTVCGGTDNNRPVVWVKSYKRTTPDGPWELQSSNTDSEGEWRALWGFSQTTTYNPTLISIRLNGVEQPLPTEGEPVDRKVPRPAPLPLLPVTPSPAPAVPAPAPQPEPEREVQPVPSTPGPKAPPATTPLVPQRAAPVRVPGATPTKDGAIVPQAPAPVPVTTPDAHFPVPGAPPVTGNGPRPTPEGIAQELGRLEQKLAKMLDPGPDGPGDGTDRQQLLEQRMRQIWEFLTSITAGGGYSLSSPCVLDDNDNRVVTTVEYGGGFNALDVISNKIDALAELIQVHKDLKQPNCTPKKPVGQPVTVNFVQID